MNPPAFKDPGFEMAVRLRKVIDVRENTLAGHLDRVAAYSCAIARMLGLPEDMVEQLNYAAPLHDIGKLLLDTAIIDKPTRLNRRERAVMETHTTLGFDILKDSQWPVIQCAARIARSHHENWDGSGYPDGLAGTDIPLEARIVAVADVYDALLSERSYKRAWTLKETLGEIQRLKGIKFDPEIIDQFLKHLPEPIASAA